MGSILMVSLKGKKKDSWVFSNHPLPCPAPQLFLIWKKGLVSSLQETPTSCWAPRCHFWVNQDQCCSSLFLVAVINTIPKASLVERHFFGLKVTVIIERSKGRDWSRDHGGRLFAGLHSSLSYTAQAPLPKSFISHSGMGTHTSVSSKENVPETWRQATLMEAIPQLKFPPQVGQVDSQ